MNTNTTYPVSVQHIEIFYPSDPAKIDSDLITTQRRLASGTNMERIPQHVETTEVTRWLENLLDASPYERVDVKISKHNNLHKELEGLQKLVNAHNNRLN